MAGAVMYAGRQASVGERFRELLAVLSRPGPPSPGLPALRGGFVVFHFGKGWGWGREGQDPEGSRRPGELGSVILDFQRLPSRWRPGTIQSLPVEDPRDLRPPRAHLGFAAARLGERGGLGGGGGEELVRTLLRAG